MPPVTPGDLDAAWDTFCLPRERRETFWTAVAFTVLVPAWYLVDLALEPAQVGWTLPLRVVATVATAGIAWLAPRASRVGQLRALLATAFLVTAASLAPLLPRVEHYFVYLCAYSLWWWGLGLGTAVPLRWGLGVMAGLAAIGLANWFGGPALRTSSEGFATVAYLGSAAVIGAMAIHARRRAMREVFDVNAALGARQRELEAALARVHALSGLLPVCAWCKSVRTDDGYWQEIDRYLSEQTGATLTHAMCPDCYARHFAEGAVAQTEVPEA